MRVGTVLLLLPILTCSASGRAGVYDYSSSPTFDQPGRVNHTYGYTGVSAALTISVCAEASAEAFVPSILEAIAIWNDRTVVVPNCEGFCRVYFDSLDLPPLPAPTGPVDATAVLLHELGHCLFGLDHTNNYHPDGGNLGGSDFTNSYDEASFTDFGPDQIRGTGDDKPTPWPGTRVVHWFRTGIDDPYLPGPGMVDNSNYTRAIPNLPASHHWPTNANRRVGVYLGYGSAQSVMFGLMSRRSRFTGLVPDDVNTVSYAQAGLDEVLGGDDYTYTLQYVDSCVGANVKVTVAALSTGTLGESVYIFEGLPIEGELLRHYALDSSLAPSTLRLTDRVPWSFQFILWDDFEKGDTSFWTTTSPP